jgi:hypothetical protein
MPAEVVAEASGQVVDAFFFDQAVGRVVGELVRRIVFVDQRGQANRRVVFVANALALGVLAAARQATGGAQQARSVAFAVGVRTSVIDRGAQALMSTRNWKRSLSLVLCSTIRCQLRMYSQ